MMEVSILGKLWLQIELLDNLEFELCMQNLAFGSIKDKAIDYLCTLEQSKRFLSKKLGALQKMRI